MLLETPNQLALLDTFEKIVRSRRATRHFKTDALPDGMIGRLLESANWAPSGYNLQPAHFFVVQNPVDKRDLHLACFKQRQILEAPATVVFAGDTRVAKENFLDVLRMEREAGSISQTYEKLLRRVVPLMFSRGPLGLGCMGKAIGERILRPFIAVPEFPAVHLRHWLSKQVMLGAMNFMLAAEAAGLASVPMEGFDESRVRKAIGASRRFRIFLLVPVGYAAEDSPTSKTRLPLTRKLHWVGGEP